MALTETLTARRLGAIVVALVVIATAGTTAYVLTGGELLAGETDAGPIGSVPEDVDFVVYADPGVGSDRTTKALVNGFIDIAQDQGDYAGPEDYAALRANVSADAETDEALDDLNHAVMYGKYPDVSAAGSGASETDVRYLGVLVDAEWSEDRFVEIVANGSAYERGEYEGYTVYVQQPAANDSAAAGEIEAPTWVGVLADGRYVLGTERAVKDALDVEAGALPPVGGELRESYDETREGYLTFALAVPKPSEVTPATRAVLTDNQFGAFRNLSTVAGSYYTDGESIGMQLRLGAATEDDAADLQAVLQGTFALTEESMRTREMERLIDSTTIEREGTSVVVTFQHPVAEILDAVEAGVESWNELSQFSTAFGAGDSYGDIAGADDGRDATESNASAEAVAEPSGG